MLFLPAENTMLLVYQSLALDYWHILRLQFVLVAVGSFPMDFADPLVESLSWRNESLW